jgi:hypothetical protein
MNEAKTRAEHIDPALKAAGWGVVEGSKVLRQPPITLGCVKSLYPQKLAALDALKKSLLHQAFSGRLSDREEGSGKVGLSLVGR